METVNKLPDRARYVQGNNPNANNFVYFPYPETLEYYTVTGSNANKPNQIFKETFLLDKEFIPEKILKF